jgi:beta-lactamase superfamily II metal-dependent hydrolase
MEKEYIRIYQSFLKSDLLKAGHHGSKTSSSFDFLNEVKPKYGLISAGLGNKFKHPNKVVLERMNKLGIKIYRTDKSGAILLNCDGTKISSIDWRNY